MDRCIDGWMDGDGCMDDVQIDVWVDALIHGWMVMDAWMMYRLMYG